MKKSLQNTFSWSVSRDRIFRECPRQYYFNYYGHWGGWEVGAPERTRRIYVLKQLKNRATWVGEVVHDCIARTLNNLSRGIPILRLDDILTITRDRMRQDFRSSRAKRYWDRPKTNCGLFEHEYDLDVSDSEWKASAEHAEQCLRTFYSSSHYEMFRQMDRSKYLEIEKFSSFLLDGIEIKIKLDCAHKENGTIIIWDWKTGKTENEGDALQMACYAFYAMQNYGADLSNITTRLYNLYRDKVHSRSINKPSLEELLTYIRGSIEDMRALLADPQLNEAEEDHFAKVELPRICLKCNYLGACKPSL
ncbi:MAG: DUF2800 domain-containing protein [Candidatus Latescibacteria bacterium]|nr:DUF2800 domain-containing protein [Candidatus Latescibacterota bacterium]NIO01036.1 DUF2800 domain-containing protein [Candidatus Latescibacterota bacterium]NIO27435.1 DUF2800 domain-containing protein [Candidatus Latescibacterota bacterium]NIO54957.1 DUF2800 domain-containing protein [Candidatus Latescibacterota bacterium]NIT01046.1 DUF2800 domain-containing protein [Candidatus Latescibacterota bacterium]